MANLAASAVTHEKGWKSLSTPSQLTTRHLTLVLTGQGTSTNKILASTLGFNKIHSCSLAQRSDDAGAYPAAPSYDGSMLFLYNPNQATDADRYKPADITATVRITVTGT